MKGIRYKAVSMALVLEHLLNGSAGVRLGTFESYNLTSETVGRMALNGLTCTQRTIPNQLCSDSKSPGYTE